MPFIYCNQYSVFLRQASYTLPYNSEVYNCNIRCLFNYMAVSKKLLLLKALSRGGKKATVERKPRWKGGHVRRRSSYEGQKIN